MNQFCLNRLDAETADLFLCLFRICCGYGHFRSVIALYAPSTFWHKMPRSLGFILTYIKALHITTGAHNSTTSTSASILLLSAGW